MPAPLIKEIQTRGLSVELWPCDRTRDGPFIRNLTQANFYIPLKTTYGWNEERHRREPTHPEEYAMVRRGGATIGFIALRDEPTCLYLSSIQLVPEARGAGIGTSLMRHAENVAKATGHRTIRLRVFHTNRAVALYRRLGYAIESSDEHSAIMRKTVWPRPPDGG